MELSAAIDLQAGFGGADWPAGETPLGGILVTQQTLDDPTRRTAFEEFATAYDAAVNYTMQNPDEAAQIVAQGYADTFGSNISAEAIAGALKSGRLLFRSRPAQEELQPELDAFLAQIIGTAPDDGFYVP